MTTSEAPLTYRARALARRDADPYESGRHSYFRDSFLVARAAAIERSTVAAMRDGFKGGPEAAEARARLAAAERFERRDVTAGDPGAAGFVPAGTPSFVAEAAALAARRAAVFSNLVDRRPLPPLGQEVSVPRFDVGSRVASQATENAPIPETDVDTSRIIAPVRTIGGFVDVSLQAFERAGEGARELDMALAEELGRALAEELDRQCIAGTGASGEHLGLLSVAGAITVGYTDASPTPGELLGKILDARARVAQALGRSPSVLLVHPRRAAWMQLTAADPGIIGRLRELGAEVLEVPVIPADRGAGANEDVVLWAEPTEAVLFADAPRFSFHADPGAGNLTARVRLVMLSAFAAHRRPEAIGVISGSGLTPPTFA